MKRKKKKRTQLPIYACNIHLNMLLGLLFSLLKCKFWFYTAFTIGSKAQTLLIQSQFLSVTDCYLVTTVLNGMSVLLWNILQNGQRLKKYYMCMHFEIIFAHPLQIHWRWKCMVAAFNTGLSKSRVMLLYLRLVCIMETSKPLHHNPISKKAGMLL